MSEEYKVWTCKIIVKDEKELPNGFDSPPRNAAIDAIEAHGFNVVSCFSGWRGKVSKLEKAIIDDDDCAAINAIEK